jgi:hypothetical protein
MVMQIENRDQQDAFINLKNSRHGEEGCEIILYEYHVHTESRRERFICARKTAQEHMLP